mmetsp:Transcript_124182/g.322551  ORF Transcript_124182/g.322551 Transcript_124182/m.322551 type:complete len:300 (-) Transcript_124182:328-1227(-)
MLKKTLGHAAAIHVRGHALSFGLHSFDDEGHGVGGHLLDALLDDMVAVHALDARNDILLELRCHHELRLTGHVLDRLLDDTATMCLIRKYQKLRVQFSNDFFLLVHTPNIEKFLHNKVTVRIVCQCNEVALDAREDQLLVVLFGSIKRTLQEAAAVRVTCKLKDVWEHFPKRNFRLCSLLAHLVQRRAAIWVIITSRTRRACTVLGTFGLVATASFAAALAIALSTFPTSLATAHATTTEAHGRGRTWHTATHRVVHGHVARHSPEHGGYCEWIHSRHAHERLGHRRVVHHLHVHRHCL